MAIQNLPINLKKDQKGPDWTTAIIAILLSLVAIVLYVLPKYSQWQQNKVAIASTEQQLITLNQQKSGVQASVSTIGKNQTSFDLVNIALPDKPRLSDVFAHLELLAKSSNMSISTVQGNDPSLNPQDMANGVGAAVDSTAPVSPSPTIGVLPIRIELRGSIDNLKIFLTALEKSLRLIDVQSININENENSSLTFNINLYTYYQK